LWQINGRYQDKLHRELFCVLFKAGKHKNWNFFFKATQENEFNGKTEMTKETVASKTDQSKLCNLNNRQKVAWHLFV
jgi:hypothetical protein